SFRQELRGEIQALRGETRQRITVLRQEMERGIAALRQEVKAEINTPFNRLMLVFTGLGVVLPLLTLLR
ncbi:MAG: DUF1640 domain-containing protein, partial [Thermus sp.]|nr:DUF1640 domain-containing protein [Thermus sp.]